MCFSATANFAGSAVLGAIGVATIAEVKHRRELLFASLPCLFALHQFTEGFVWLGINGKFPRPRCTVSPRPMFYTRRDCFHFCCR